MKNGKNYNAPLFRESVEEMKDILDGDYDPKNFKPELSSDLYHG